MENDFWFFQVEDLVNSLNIQTGNMCQFLPQVCIQYENVQQSILKFFRTW